MNYFGTNHVINEHEDKDQCGQFAIQTENIVLGLSCNIANQRDDIGKFLPI